jgi:hypothetical protein
MIVVFSEGGKVARLLAKYRPCAPVLVVTSNPAIARYCAALFGCYPKLLSKPIQDVAGVQQAVAEAMAFGVEHGLCVAGKEASTVARTRSEVCCCVRWRHAAFQLLAHTARETCRHPPINLPCTWQKREAGRRFATVAKATWLFEQDRHSRSHSADLDHHEE